MNNPFVHITEGEFTMKKLHKKFESVDVSLSAYYTCMCNYPPCVCDGDYRDGSGTASMLNSLHEDLDHIEDVSWNN